jgi:hypothetical protein
MSSTIKKQTHSASTRPLTTSMNPLPTSNQDEPSLWCIEHSPVQSPDYHRRLKDQLTFLLQGPGDGTPEDPDPNKARRAMMWTAFAMAGIGDNRQPHYEKCRQKLAIFRTERAAKKYAQKLNAKNEYWTATAKPIRMMPDGDSQG